MSVTEKPTYPKYGTVAYIVGYDGQEVGGSVPSGRWVLPIDGIQGHAELFDTEEGAAQALSSLPSQTKRTITLGGTKELVLAVHKIKVRRLPINDGHIGYAKVEKVRVPSSEAEPLPKWTNILFLIGLGATLFDAVMSFITIGLVKVAVEGSPIQNFITSVIQTTFALDAATAFGFTMIIRALLGSAMLLGLFLVARFRPYHNERRLAVFGIWLCSVVLSAVSLYHVIGLLFLTQ